MFPISLLKNSEISPEKTSDVNSLAIETLWILWMLLWIKDRVSVWMSPPFTWSFLSEMCNSCDWDFVDIICCCVVYTNESFNDSYLNLIISFWNVLLLWSTLLWILWIMLLCTQMRVWMSLCYAWSFLPEMFQLFWLRFCGFCECCCLRLHMRAWDLGIWR